MKELHTVFLLALFAIETLADISTIHPPSGSCLCLTASSVNIRATACGTVIGTANTGTCYTSRGTKTQCTLSGTTYQFFDVNYGSGVGWIAGTYLNVADSSSCQGGTAPTSEFRSVFIATAWNVDWPTSASDSTSAQQQQMINYLNMMASTNMNAVVFQIRPAGDAFYSSAIEPWSRYLTGTQGQAPSPFYDPLAFVVSEAHARGIEVHAWLNPYRANLAPNWNGLAPNHMANVYRQYAYPYSNYLWMDPGASVVVDHLVSVIEDVITRYNVDGIHFDDYFYPYPDGSVQFPDSSTYNSYVSGGGTMSRDDWRRDNVNRMVQRVYNRIKAVKPGVKFSISPFGIYRPGNSQGMPAPITGLDPYTAMYADSKRWLQSGWLDFFAPQLYWAIAPPAQSYPTLLDWWLDNNPLGRHIYAANGVYKIADSNNWPVSEIENQIGISRATSRRQKHSLGNIMYSAKYFRDNTKGITDAFRTRVYPNRATTPPMAWLGLARPDPPRSVTVQGTKISWDQVADSDATRWSLTRKEGADWVQYRVLPGHVTEWVVEPGSYALTALNMASEHSSEVFLDVATARQAHRQG